MNHLQLQHRIPSYDGDATISEAKRP